VAPCRVTTVDLELQAQRYFGSMTHLEFEFDDPFRIAALGQSKRPEERKFYLRMAVRERWVTAFARFL
jgi:hypothetical protein